MLGHLKMVHPVPYPETNSIDPGTNTIGSGANTIVPGSPYKNKAISLIP
jgi:hypothetical protein